MQGERIQRLRCRLFRSGLGRCWRNWYISSPSRPFLSLKKRAPSIPSQTPFRRYKLSFPCILTLPQEQEFLQAEIPIFSNAKNHRRNPLVPLVVPTVNLPHLDLIPHQRTTNNLRKGFLVCNSNCAVIGLVGPFAALQAAFGPITTVSIVTMQAVSGAGYPGVSSMDIMDNVVPFISGEEDKLETEARKILGHMNDSKSAFVEQSGLRVSATCNRVPVMDGHTACVSLKFEKQPAPSAEECKAALRGYVCEAQRLGCPSAPNPAIWVFDEPDRPQPRLDRDLGNGYTVSVGRVREDESGIFDLKFTALSHNSKFFWIFPFKIQTCCKIYKC